MEWDQIKDLVLLAIEGGAKDVKDISKATGLSRSDVEAAILRLRIEGLVEARGKKSILGVKEVYQLTEKGMREAEGARERVRSIAREIESAVASGDQDALDSLLSTYSAFIPLMLYLGMIDLFVYDLLSQAWMDSEGGYEAGDAGEDTFSV